MREATALQLLAALDTDRQAALTQRERVMSLRDVYLPKATQARDTVEYAYRRGGQSLLDFLDTQRSYRETALAHLQALGAYLSALYQLEADIGGPAGPVRSVGTPSTKGVQMSLLEEHPLLLGFLAIAIGVGLGKTLEVWRSRRIGPFSAKKREPRA